MEGNIFPTKKDDQLLLLPPVLPVVLPVLALEVADDVAAVVVAWGTISVVVVDDVGGTDSV